MRNTSLIILMCATVLLGTIPVTATAETDNAIRSQFLRYTQLKNMRGLKDIIGQVDQDTKNKALMRSIQDYLNPIPQDPYYSPEDVLNVVKLLLENGADPNALQFEGRRPDKRVRVPGAPGVSMVKLGSPGEISDNKSDGQSVLEYVRGYMADSESKVDAASLMSLLKESGAR